MAGQEKTAASTLHLLVQTPFDLFVYWEIDEQYLEMARNGLQYSDSRLVLKLFRLEHGVVEEVAVSVLQGDNYAGSTYFYGQRPYTTYYAEMGLFYLGGYFTLLRSNYVSTPPAGRVTGEGIQPPRQWQDVPPRLPFAYSPGEKDKGR